MEVKIVPWTLGCARLSEEQLDLWNENLAAVEPVLKSDAQLLPGELVRVYGEDFSVRGFAEPQDLTPESIHAIRVLTCLARDLIGGVSTREIRFTIPQLTARMGFPEACRGVGGI